MLIWTRRRAAAKYGISSDDASDVLLWTIFGVFIGATLGGYMDHWTRYVESPVRLLYFWQSGVSSGPGFIGGGLAGLYKLRRRKISVDCFAESAAAPCAFMLFVGRWGCFLNGCCEGIPTSSAWGVSFPQNPLVRVFPSQIFESFSALLIGVLILVVEGHMKRASEDAARGAVVWPLFLVLYGLYRFAFDFLRAGDRIFGLRVGQYAGVFACLVGAVWLVYSLKKISRRAPEGEPRETSL
jgi:phosphatidylglycerol:prolipoprotein diacylglycerol transferase